MSNIITRLIFVFRVVQQPRQQQQDTTASNYGQHHEYRKNSGSGQNASESKENDRISASH